VIFTLQLNSGSFLAEYFRRKTRALERLLVPPPAKYLQISQSRLAELAFWFRSRRCLAALKRCVSWLSVSILSSSRVNFDSDTSVLRSLSSTLPTESLVVSATAISPTLGLTRRNRPIKIRTPVKKVLNMKIIVSHWPTSTVLINSKTTFDPKSILSQQQTKHEMYRDRSVSRRRESAFGDQAGDAAEHKLQAERHLVDAEDYAEEQQQRAEPANDEVRSQHGKPI